MIAGATKAFVEPSKTVPLPLSDLDYDWADKTVTLPTLQQLETTLETVNPGRIDASAGVREIVVNNIKYAVFGWAKIMHVSVVFMNLVSSNRRLTFIQKVCTSGGDLSSMDFTDVPDIP